MYTLEIFGTLPPKKGTLSGEKEHTRKRKRKKKWGKSEPHTFIGKIPAEVVRIHAERCELPASELTGHSDDSTSRIDCNSKKVCHHVS